MVQAQTFMSASLAPNSKSTYKSAWKSYINFCIGHGLQPLPATERNLILYFTHAAIRNIAHSSMTVYLSGLRHHCQLFGHDINIESMNSLYHLLRGIRRTQGNSLTRPKRQPIKLSHLSKLHFYVSLHFKTSDANMLWCAFTMAFFGLLRSSEYTSPGDSAVSSSNLLFNHVTVSADSRIMFIYLHGSKTDPFRKGVVIRLYRLTSPFCPVQAALRYIQFHPSNTGPFFQFQNGTHLTRIRISNILQATFPMINNINTHSFRIGGASMAASHGIPDSIIQIMGRWSSDCFRQYIQLPDANLAAYQQIMTDPAHHSRLWDSDSLSSRLL